METIFFLRSFKYRNSKRLNDENYICNIIFKTWVIKKMIDSRKTHWKFLNTEIGNVCRLIERKKSQIANTQRF